MERYCNEMMAGGDYPFRDQDSPIMTCMDRKHPDLLPSSDLIDGIDETRRKGLRTED